MLFLFRKVHPMSKKKTSYADVWIKAYLAALTRLPSDEAYKEANRALMDIKLFLNCAKTDRLYFKIKNPTEVDITERFQVVPEDTWPGKPFVDDINSI